jgi:DNA repair exonuclease SbcCD ATPase subunit
MLILEEVSWGDCFSYGNQNTLKLNENTITQLIGDNGAGKSSISLIIQEALYNKNSKGIKKADIPNRINTSKNYWITLNFSYNNKKYEVKINRKSSLKVNLIEDGVDISSHTATETFKTIEKLLGVDYKVFVQLMYQSVTDGLTFLTATDSNRKKFLIDLFGLDEYDKYHNVFKDLSRELTSKVTRVSGNIESLQKWISKNSDPGEVKELLEEPEKPEEPSELRELKDKLAKIKDHTRRVNSNNKLKEILKSIEFDSNILSQPKVETKELTSFVGEFNSIIKNQTAFYNKINKLDNKCPTCEQPINKKLQEELLQEAKNQINSAKVKLTSIQEELAEAEKHNRLVEKHTRAKADWEKTYVQIDNSLESSVESVSSLTSAIKSLETEMEVLRDRYETVLRENAAISARNARIEVIKEQLQEHRAELENYREVLREVSETCAIVETLKKAFSNNGLVAHKLENLVKDIEELTNSYLSELSDGRFTLLFTIVSDKLNVVLTDNGQDINISALSSGELAMVNVATLLAIRKMMNSISKTQINILFLDEAINVLAEHGRDCLIDVLLKEEGLNTFLVSHGWSHPLLAKVIISKEDGISRLNYG